MEPESNTGNMHLAFVGSVVPDRVVFWGTAFSRAGNMWQENLLSALQTAGMDAEIVLSQRPMRVWPRGRRLYCRAREDHLTGGMPVRLVGFVNVPVLRRLTVGISVMVALWRWGRQQRAGLHAVLCYNLTDPQASWILRGARLARATVVAMVCDVNIPGQTVPDTRRYRVDWHSMCRALPQFNGLLAISSAVAEDLAPMVPSMVVEGGLSRELYDKVAGIPEGGSRRDGTFSIVAAGYLAPLNGFREILDAFSRLDGEEYRLDIAGWGPLADEIGEAAKRDGRITFHGMLDLDGVLRLYASASVLVNMMLTRAVDTRYFYPSKTWELLATGIPLITPCPASRERDWADFVFPLEDETASGLAEVLRHVAATSWERRAQMGLEARSWIRKQGIWQDQGTRIADFVSRVARDAEREREERANG